MIRPTIEEAKRRIDELITPELADSEAKIFADLVSAVSDPNGNPEAYELAGEIRRYVFTKTSHFENAFRAWAGESREVIEEKEKVSHVSHCVN